MKHCGCHIIIYHLFTSTYISKSAYYAVREKEARKWKTMRQGKAKYVFPGSNTPSGFFSFYKEGLKGLERVYILKGGPGTGKSTLMRKIGIAMLERGYDVEFWQCSSDNDSIDGVIIPGISLAVIDGTPPHNLDPTYPGAVEEIVNLGDHWNDEYLRQHRREIINITENITADFDLCYAKLKTALEKRKKWGKYFGSHIDKEKIDQTTDELITQIFYHPSRGARHLFASSVTPRGLISFADSISRGYDSRYLLIGPPDCGKELLMERIAALAAGRGHNLEIYHNAFVPENIELIVLPDLSIAILSLDANCDEVRNETNLHDHIIDCHDFMIKEDSVEIKDDDNDEIDETNNESKELAEQFYNEVNEAAEYIADAKSQHDALEYYYSKAMDFEAVDIMGNQLFNKILGIAASHEK